MMNRYSQQEVAKIKFYLIPSNVLKLKMQVFAAISAKNLNPEPITSFHRQEPREKHIGLR